MRLHEYYGRTEFSILQFTFKVTDDIKRKYAESYFITMILFNTFADKWITFSKSLI